MRLVRPTYRVDLEAIRTFRAIFGRMRLIVIATLLFVACGPSASVRARPVATPTLVAYAWPGVAWDHAEAVAFNQIPYGRGIEGMTLDAWEPAHGLNASIVERKPLTPALATRAVELVAITHGGIEVSKCAFPRHGIVFYRGEQPVASVSVCFECGDILVSPDPRAHDPDAKPLTEAELAAAEREYDARLAEHKIAFPRWQALFRDDLGFSLVVPK